MSTSSSSMQTAAFESLLGEPYARKLSRTALKAGYMFGLSGGEKWQRRYFVLKPTTLLYSFGSSGDEEPLGCVDIENFERCDCGGIEEDGSVVIELVRSKGQTLRLKAAESEWYACLKNETYGRLKDTAAILRKQRDEFAAHITSLEESTASAENRAQRAEKLQQLAEMRLSYLLDSVAKAAGALLGGDPIIESEQKSGAENNSSTQHSQEHSHSEQSLVNAVQRIVEHSHKLEAALSRAREKHNGKRDALEAQSAAFLALLAAERRKTRTLERANTRLHASVNELKSQRRALCKAVRTKETLKIKNTPSGAAETIVTKTQSQSADLNTHETTLGKTSEDDAEDSATTEQSQIYIHQDDEENEDQTRLAFRENVRARLLAALRSEPQGHRRESSLIEHTDDDTVKATEKHDETKVSAIDTSLHEITALAEHMPDLDTGSDMLEHWLDDDDEDDAVLRVTYVRPRIGIIFAVNDGAIKVNGYTEDYDPDLPRPAPESLLVAINGHPLAPDLNVNFRTLKQAKRPLVLDFSTLVPNSIDSPAHEPSTPDSTTAASYTSIQSPGGTLRAGGYSSDRSNTPPPNFTAVNDAEEDFESIEDIAKAIGSS